MIKRSFQFGAMALFAIAIGCKGSGAGKELPPTTGAGAPEAPTLPKFKESTGDDPVEPTQGKTTGSTYAHSEAQIAASVTGTIKEVLVKEGDIVKKGDVLFRLDSRDASLRLSQARVGLKAAEVNLKAIQVEFDRTKTMVDQNAINRAQWDQVQARHEAAAVGVEQARIGVSMASKAVSDTTTRSPITGVVTAKLKSEGETATTMPPAPVVVIQDLAIIDVRFRLPESALRTLRPKDKIRLRFPALDVTRDVEITRINPLIDQRSRAVEVVAEVENRDLLLKPGILAEVELAAAPSAPPKSEVPPLEKAETAGSQIGGTP